MSVSLINQTVGKYILMVHLYSLIDWILIESIDVFCMQNIQSKQWKQKKKRTKKSSSSSGKAPILLWNDILQHYSQLHNKDMLTDFFFLVAIHRTTLSIMCCFCCFLFVFTLPYSPYPDRSGWRRNVIMFYIIPFCV